MVEVKNSKKLRCIPQNLSMSEASPVCQPWTYASAHPMEDILSPKYFLSAYDRLRPGDTIRAVQMSESNIHSRSNKVLEFANITITSVDRDHVGMHVERRVAIGEGGEAEDVKTEIVSGDQTFGAYEVANRMEEINRFINSGAIGLMQESISGLKEGEQVLLRRVDELKKLVEADSGLSTTDVETADHITLEEVEIPVIKWNPGKKRHEAVTGKGDALKVLFSNKDRKKVESWLESVSGSEK